MRLALDTNILAYAEGVARIYSQALFGAASLWSNPYAAPAHPLLHLFLQAR